ncbi:cholecystokinin receptor type A-like [Mytilus californianus]|uniref:cholecystokinin receptor type A-like n=1 Tax=Mytilus californianus TaxID=6549 RepID=UPI002246BC71|nr:cholecystokinin receptor type A-like [Mytilus californianus]
MAALLISVAATLTKNTKQVIFPGFEACKLFLYFSYVSTSISLYLLCVIAIQRYLKICRPFGRQMNLVWKRCSVLICTLVSVILFIPVLFYYGLVEIRNPNLGNITGNQCSNLPGSPTKLKLLKIFQGLEVFATFCNVSVITILYILITNAIVKQTSKMKTVQTKVENSNVATAGRSETREMETRIDTSPRVTGGKKILSTYSDPRKSAFRISFMFMTITIVGFLAYLPSWTFILIETNNPTFWKNLSTVSFHICLALRRMYMVNHLCNPFIYGVFDKAFREEVKKLFGKHV